MANIDTVLKRISDNHHRALADEARRCPHDGAILEPVGPHGTLVCPNFRFHIGDQAG